MDAAAIAVRLAQYATLAPLFGLACFALYADKASRILGPGHGRLMLALAGLVASLASLPVLAAQMTGGLAGAFDVHTLRTVMEATAAGRAWLVRIVAMIGAIAVVRSYRPWLMAAFAGVALASLAWGGHAAGGEGGVRYVHLAGDVVHLGAAGLWLGAIAAFTGLVLRGRDPAVTAQALARFSSLGSLAVAALIATGLINLWPSAHWRPLPILTTSLWGQLLMLKLVLFLAMLWRAAANRFVLTPRLQAEAQGPSEPETGRLRLSLVIELILGLAVLAAVSVLGVLPLPIDQ